VTTNVVASPFAALRLRTSAAKRFNKVGRATAIIWRLLRIAVKRFRKLNAPEQCRDVYSGVRYVDGAEVPAVPSTQIAAAERTFTHFLKRPPDCGEGQVEFLNRRVDFDRLPSWLPAAMRPLQIALDTRIE